MGQRSLSPECDNGQNGMLCPRKETYSAVSPKQIHKGQNRSGPNFLWDLAWPQERFMGDRIIKNLLKFFFYISAKFVLQCSQREHVHNVNGKWAKRSYSLVQYNWLTNKFNSFAVLGVKWREIDEKTFGLQVFSKHIPKPKNQSINQSSNQ